MQKLLRTVLGFLPTMPTTTTTKSTTTTKHQRSTSVVVAAATKLTSRGTFRVSSSNSRGGGCPCWLQRRFGGAMGTIMVVGMLWLLLLALVHQKPFFFLNDFAIFCDNNSNNMNNIIHIHHGKNDNTVLIAPPTSLRMQQRRTETADVEPLPRPETTETKAPPQQKQQKRGRQYTVSFQTRQGKWRHPIRPLHHVSLQDLPDLTALPQPPLPHNDNNDNHHHVPDEKQWILHQLHEAGVERLDPNVMAQLPTDAQIQRLYYSSVSTSTTTSSSSPSSSSSSSSSTTLGHPVVRGMETCAAYRRSVPREQRYVGVAGLFNSGTTALSIYLQHNLVRRLVPHMRSQLSKDQMTTTMTTTTTSSPPFDYQVPWGKHRLFRFHDDITYRRKDWPVDILDPHHVLPIVIVRDPLFWMQSMCESPYTLQWDSQPDKEEDEDYNHHHNQCPHVLRDPTTSHTNITGTKTTIPVSLPTQGKTQFASLAHLWKTWYQEYMVLPQSSVHPEDRQKPLLVSSSSSSSPLPLQRLVIRLEDLLFHPRAVMERIEECVWGNETALETKHSSSGIAANAAAGSSPNGPNNDDRFVYLVGRSKWSQEYRKPQSSMISAMIKYGGGTMARHNRVAHWRPEEVHYLNELLGDMMDALGYQRGEVPSVSS